VAHKAIVPPKMGRSDMDVCVTDRSIACQASPPLTALHRRTIAVELGIGGRNQVLLGRGAYELDSVLGNTLRIEFPSSADFEFILAEDSWNGQILSGVAYGCDFLIQIRE
jgi:hypothetical protein